MNTTRNRVITIGVSDLSFHRVSASLLTHVLKEMGFDVNRIYSPHRDNFGKLKSGHIDLLTSAWLPYNDGEFVNELEKELPLIELGPHYEPYSLWAVPDYVPANEVNEISDLSKKKVIRKMRPAIQGICPGAGITRSSINMMDHYGLSKSGYRFFTGCEECCYTTLEKAIENKEWIVLPLWKPNFLHIPYKIRELKDPKGLLGTADRAVFLLREDRKHLFTDEELEVLNSLYFSNNTIAKLDYEVSYQNKPLDKTTEQYLQVNA